MREIFKENIQFKTIYQSATKPNGNFSKKLDYNFLVVILCSVSVKCKSNDSKNISPLKE